MEFIDRQLLIEDSFYRIELSHSSKIAFVFYTGPFDIEKYKQATLMVLDLFSDDRAQSVITDHRNTDPLPREAQKWFVHDLSRILKTRFADKLDKLVLVSVIDSKDVVRKAIAGFLVYMLKLFVGIRCYYASSMEEALKYCGSEHENIEE